MSSIQRDEFIDQLKTLLKNNSLELFTYLKQISYIFRYDKVVNKSVENKEHLLHQKQRYCNILQQLTHQISLSSIQDKDYNFIKNYIALHRDQFIEKVQLLRNVIDLPFYRFQNVDETVSQIFSNKFKSFVFPKTTGDGNCLYNAISLVLFGDENKMETVKLSMLFSSFEYETFIRKYLGKFQQSFEQFIEVTTRDKEWGNDDNFIGLSIATLRPIYSLTSTSDLWCNPTSSTRDPIIICNHDEHFTAAVKISQNAQVVYPRYNQLALFKEPFGLVNYYH